MDPLLQAATEAHGGLDRWAQVRAIDFTFNFWGDVPEFKGYLGRRQPTFTIDTVEPRTVIQRLDGDPDRRWIFTPDRVWFEERDGLVVEERLNPRAAFQGRGVAAAVGGDS